jgi:radical SAM superfamily enzyme YgiQ (UPF0313 family)
MKTSNVDVVFIPPLSSDLFSTEFEYACPIGIISLVASLRKTGYNSKMYKISQNLVNEKIYEKMANDIVNFNSKIVGFSTYCNSYSSSLILAKIIKRLNPKVCIVFGGPHASNVDIETLEDFNCVDYILRGEADNTIISFVKYILSNNLDKVSTIPGLTFRKQHNNTLKVQRNASADYIKDLDKLPLPAYDLIDLKNKKSVEMDIGRGCPFECTFCSTKNFFSRKYRIKSIKRILFEMDWLFDNYEITDFCFNHDMFTMNRNYIIDFCEILIKHKKKIKRDYTWNCSARIDCVDKELLIFMANSGCTGIFFGIESGSEKIQKLIKKRLQISEIYNICRETVSLGMDTAASFMIGFPYENRNDINMTLKTIINLCGIGVKPQMSILSPLPHTEIYYEVKNSILFDGFQTDFTRDLLSFEDIELIKKYPKIFSSFYFVPSNIASRDTFIIINIITNSLKYFPLTIKILWTSIKKELKLVSILEILEDKISTQNIYKLNVISLLIDIFTKYIKYIYVLKNIEVPFYITDVFKSEAILALMSYRFHSISIFNNIESSKKKHLN